MFQRTISPPWPSRSRRSPTSAGGCPSGTDSIAPASARGPRGGGTISREGPMRFRLVVNGEAHEVTTDGRVTVDGAPVVGEVVKDARGVSVRIGRKRYRLLITRWGSMVEGTPYRLEVRDLEPGKTSDRMAARKSTAGLVEVRPPMPGRIVQVAVKPGRRVGRNA